MERGINRQTDWIAGAIAGVNSPRPLVRRLVSTLAISLMLCCCLDACGGSSSGTTTSPPQEKTLTAITIDAVNSSIAVGTTLQLHATGAFSDGTTEDLTASVTWASANTSVATVNDSAGSKGLVAGGSVGVTTITATQNGRTGVSAFTVTQTNLTSITVEPVNPFVAKGTTVQLAAEGNFSDGSVQDLTTQVSWSSANSSTAVVSDASPTQGLVTGVSTGNTPITATLGGIQGSTTVTVTAATLTAITITVPVETIARGTTVQLSATCNFNDGTTLDCTTQVSWTSGNNVIAQVSDASPTQGLVTGVSVGNTTISGSLGGIQGSATVTVSSATLTSISITPPNAVLVKGTALQLTATGTFNDGTTENLTTQVSWTSGDNAIAQVSDVLGRQGLLTVLSTGSTSISATLNGIHRSITVTVTAPTLTSLTITPPALSIAKGTTIRETATCDFSDGTTQDCTGQVSWTSADNTIAQASDAAGSKGLVTGLGVGSTAITVTLSGIEGSTTITVTPAVLTALIITPTSPFTPPAPSIAKGTALQLVATGDFSDGTIEDLTTQVSWTSGDTTIAQVSEAAGTNGLVTGVSIGNTPITATLGGVQGSITVIVSAATLTSIQITPPNSSIAKGTTQQLTATGVFSDKTTQDLTTSVSWTSSPEGVATVNATGLVAGTATGSATIAATQDGVSGLTRVTTTRAIPTALVVTPVNNSIVSETTVQLTATVAFSDGSTQDLTSSMSWSSNDPSIATVDADGLVTGIKSGSVAIQALFELGGKRFVRLTIVSVREVVLTSIVITPAFIVLDAEDDHIFLFEATGTFSDGSTQDLTDLANWISSNKNVGLIFNRLGTFPGGFFDVGQPGDTTISATYRGVTGTAIARVID
jgi:trimeric autotransporter adhesin